MADNDDLNNLLMCSNDKLLNLIKTTCDKEEAIFRHIITADYPRICDFRKGLEWFNTSIALTFKEQLKGKLVLLDFFTYCCINCMHILPDLEDIEQEFSIDNGLVIVGVHSAKFDNEKISDNISAAIKRHNIHHPVVNDIKLDMWDNLQIFSWPTLLLVGPYSNPLIMFVGEGHRETLKLYIKCALAYYNLRGVMSNHKLPITDTYHLNPVENNETLLFPGKIANHFDKDNEEILAVSDTGHHRILLVKNDGSILKVIGNGRKGFKDGKIDEAEFASPQGLTFRNKDELYVADTENHTIRRILLDKDMVETIAGTGKQGNDQKGGKIGNKQPLSSPWDVAICNYQFEDYDYVETLLIAMAGTHQIWSYCFEKTRWWDNKDYAAETCLSIAGTGKEENRNNCYSSKGSFAQPSGLAVNQEMKEVYVADSESSTIRKISLNGGSISAVVGGDRNPCNLFAYGDEDGRLHRAKLQHPLGVAIDIKGKSLYVADTYNHKLKCVDMENDSVRTLRRQQEKKDVADFNEPGGLTCSMIKEDIVYVADTNNHCIKIVTIDKTVEPSQIKTVEKLQLRFKNEEDVDNSAVSIKKNNDKKELYEFKPMDVNCNGDQLQIKLNLNFINDTSLNTEAPQKWQLHLPQSWTKSKAASKMDGKDLKEISTEIDVPPLTPNSESSVEFKLTFYICASDICMPKDFTVRLPLRPAKDVDNKPISLNVHVDTKQVKLY